MEVSAFAKKIYYLCVKRVNDYWSDFFKSKQSYSNFPKEYEDFKTIYVSLSKDQQLVIDQMLKKISIDTLCTFCSIIDNRAIGDFDEDFILLYGKDHKKLNECELLDELQNYIETTNKK